MPHALDVSDVLDPVTKAGEDWLDMVPKIDGKDSLKVKRGKAVKTLRILSSMGHENSSLTLGDMTLVGSDLHVC